MKYTLTLVSEVSGKSIDELRSIANQKGISLPADNEAEISLDLIKQIDFSLAYTMRYAQTGSGKKEVRKPKVPKVVDKIDLSQFDRKIADSKGSQQTPTDETQETVETSNDSEEQIRSILKEMDMALAYPEEIGLKEIQGIRDKWDSCDERRRFREARNYARLLDKLFYAATLDLEERESAYKANLEKRVKVCEALESLAESEGSETPIGLHISKLTAQWYSAGPVSDEDWKIIDKRYKAVKDRLKGRKQSQSASDRKEKKTSERVIAYIKFYDNRKGFGFAATNNKGIDGKATNTLVDIYLRGSEIDGYINEMFDHWVICNIEKSHKGYNAKKIETISFANIPLELLFEYRGKYAMVSGYDANSGKTIKEDIIPSIYEQIYKEKHSYEFFSYLTNKIDSLEHELQITFIDELLSNEATLQ